jgi:hypothetical protein
MPKVTIKREGGLTLEADLSFDQIKELVSTTNGHKPEVTPVQAPHHGTRRAVKRSPKGEPNFHAFIKGLSERALNFMKILHDHPEGIDAIALTPMLGFENPAQLGGLTGPGLSKLAEKHGIKTEDLYRSEVIFPGGVRKRMFHAGPLVAGMEWNDDEKTPLFKRG